MPTARHRPPAPTGSRALLIPAAGVLAALAAVALLPFPAASLWPGGGYSDVAALGAALARGLEHWWRSGAVDAGPDLDAAVAFWARFHVVKAILSAVLLVLAVRLGRRTWHEYRQATGRGRRARLAVAGLAVSPVLVLAVLLVAANVQGALAPLSSALGLLPVGRVGAGSGSGGGGLAGTVREIRLALHSPDASVPPALARLVGDFAAYHAVMVGVGAVVTLGLAAAAVRVRQRRRGVEAEPWRLRGPRLLTATSILGLAVAFAVVTAANLSTYLHPAPALLGFFEGGA
ncbi:hypothetical protein [Intrasporangium flavum]|uniref:hypothetical protein n=1 Tax=Intrasporangium flavum TaxID=1428657 RepID=UPI00096F2FF8|nr:hypothetical protein [Intrasporangium flavum]